MVDLTSKNYRRLSSKFFSYDSVSASETVYVRHSQRNVDQKRDEKISLVIEADISHANKIHCKATEN